MAGLRNDADKPWFNHRYPAVAHRPGSFPKVGQPWCEQIYGYRRIEFDPLSGGLCRIRLELVCLLSHELIEALMGSWEIAWTRPNDDQLSVGCIHMIGARSPWGSVAFTYPCRVEAAMPVAEPRVLIRRCYEDDAPGAPIFQQPSFVMLLPYLKPLL